MNEAQQPNFLVIIGEDTGRLLGAYGDLCATTPNLDHLASQGCRYDQAFSTAPVCAPSRSALVSGQYQMKIGSHHMRSTLVEAPRIFTQELRDAGYYVSWPTKLDFNFEPQHGWRDDDELWMERLRAGDMPDQPWLAFVNIAVTHESSMWPTKKGFEHPPATHDPDEVTVPAYLPDHRRVREDIARHYDNIAELDREVGHILEALEASGEATNTVVIFLADHGRGLPREKRWCYPAGIHMPLLMHWPAGIDAGTVSKQVVSWIDIAPTILSLAGVGIPDSYDGTVFLGEAAQEREIAFAGRDRMDECFDRVRSATTVQYHYIRNDFPQLPWAQRLSYMEKMPTMQVLRQLRSAGALNERSGAFMGETKPPEELYERACDPDCVNNLADGSEHEGVRKRMAAHLDDWTASIEDLGGVPERELVERGTVTNRMEEEYRQRLGALPAEHAIGPPTTLLEECEVQAWVKEQKGG
jgi:arylsulfatase A-like enzyme